MFRGGDDCFAFRVKVTFTHEAAVSVVLVGDGSVVAGNHVGSAGLVKVFDAQQAAHAVVGLLDFGGTGVHAGERARLIVVHVAGQVAEGVVLALVAGVALGTANGIALGVIVGFVDRMSVRVKDVGVAVIAVYHEGLADRAEGGNARHVARIVVIVGDGSIAVRGIGGMSVRAEVADGGGLAFIGIGADDLRVALRVLRGLSVRAEVSFGKGVAAFVVFTLELCVGYAGRHGESAVYVVVGAHEEISGEVILLLHAGIARRQSDRFTVHAHVLGAGDDAGGLVVTDVLTCVTGGKEDGLTVYAQIQFAHHAVVFVIGALHARVAVHHHGFISGVEKAHAGHVGGSVVFVGDGSVAVTDDNGVASGAVVLASGAVAVCVEGMHLHGVEVRGNERALLIHGGAPENVSALVKLSQLFCIAESAAHEGTVRGVVGFAYRDFVFIIKVVNARRAHGVVRVGLTVLIKIGFTQELASAHAAVDHVPAVIALNILGLFAVFVVVLLVDGGCGAVSGTVLVFHVGVVLFLIESGLPVRVHVGGADDLIIFVKVVLNARVARLDLNALHMRVEILFGIHIGAHGLGIAGEGHFVSARTRVPDVLDAGKAGLAHGVLIGDVVVSLAVIVIGAVILELDHRVAVDGHGAAVVRSVIGLEVDSRSTFVVLVGDFGVGAHDLGELALRVQIAGLDDAVLAVIGVGHGGVARLGTDGGAVCVQIIHADEVALFVVGVHELMVAIAVQDGVVLGSEVAFGKELSVRCAFLHVLVDDFRRAVDAGDAAAVFVIAGHGELAVFTGIGCGGDAACGTGHIALRIVVDAAQDVFALVGIHAVAVAAGDVRAAAVGIKALLGEEVGADLAIQVGIHGGSIAHHGIRALSVKTFVGDLQEVAALIIAVERLRVALGVECGSAASIEGLLAHEKRTIVGELRGGEGGHVEPSLARGEGHDQHEDQNQNRQFLHNSASVFCLVSRSICCACASCAWKDWWHRSNRSISYSSRSGSSHRRSCWRG